MTSERTGRRAGIALVATAEDAATAAQWQEELTGRGIMSVLHGHRAEDGEDSFTGVDVLVPASQLQQARDILGPDVVPLAREDPAFPWLLLALGPALFFAGVAALVLLLAL
jgi:hypothetical protein